MSIALEAKVTELERKIALLEYKLAGITTNVPQDAGFDNLNAAFQALRSLEQTAQRKPGPKPKDAA